MKPFTVNGVNYIGVEVPDWATATKLGTTPSHEPAVYFDKEDYVELLVLPQGNYEIIGLVKDLGWDNECLLMGRDKYYYDEGGIGRDGIEVDFTHIDDQAQDWKIFKEKNNLTDNTLIIKVV